MMSELFFALRHARHDDAAAMLLMIAPRLLRYAMLTLTGHALRQPLR